MNTIQTRNNTYHQLVEKLPHKRKRVYQAFAQLGIATNHEVSKHLGIEINEVTGRTKELRDAYMLVECGIVRSPSNYPSVQFRTVTDTAVRDTLIHMDLNIKGEELKELLEEYRLIVEDPRLHRSKIIIKDKVDRKKREIANLKKLL